MSKSYRSWSPRQSFLLPPSPLDWLPEDHLVYFLLDLVEELDLRGIENAIQEKDARGNRPFDPQMMVALLLYGYCVGVASSRKLERATHEDVPFRVLTGGQHPDHTAISEFRRVHLAALEGLFIQVLTLCREAGLVELAHVALDGTKLRANASQDKQITYAAMIDAEKNLKAEVDRMLDEAERVDREEDARYGVGNRGNELPKELRTREGRLKKIREAKAAIEAEAAKRRAKELKKIEEHARAKAAKTPNEKTRRTELAFANYAASCVEIMNDKASMLEQRRSEIAGQNDACVRTLLPTHAVKADTSGAPRPDVECSLTDIDSRIMKSSGNFLRGYNCQAAVDDKHQVVIASAVTNHANDRANLRPMLDQVEMNCGALPEKLTADGGYWSPESARYCEEKRVDAYISLARERKTKSQKKPTPGEDDRRAMREKLKSEDGRATYARRSGIVEPIFGQIKAIRGFQGFLLRGMQKVGGEWSLITTTHNLLKLFRAKHGPKLSIAT